MRSQEKAIRVLLKEKEAKLTKQSKKLANTATKRALSKRIKDISAALKRMDESKYGFCERCYISIPWRELCSEPERRFCASCQANEDSRHRRRRLKQQAG